MDFYVTGGSLQRVFSEYIMAVFVLDMYQKALMPCSETHERKKRQIPLSFFGKHHIDRIKKVAR